MKKPIVIILLTLSSSLFNFCEAQQEKGQIVINAGVGNGLGINDAIFSYPIPTYGNSTSAYFPPMGSTSSMTPNIGTTIDFSIIKWMSIGLASSYESEVVNWTPGDLNFYNGQPVFYPYMDKILMFNLAGRLLFHLNKKHLYFDHYIGFRIGESFWHDVPYPSSYVNPISISYLPPPVYFMSKPNLVVSSFQVLYGMRFYLRDNLNNFGVHLEVGIGYPYLIEGGVSYRVNTHKWNIDKDNI